MARRFKFPTGGVLLFAAVVIGAASTIGTAAWLRQQDQQRAEDAAANEQQQESMVALLVGRDELAAGTTLSAPMLATVEVPQSTVPVGALTELDDAVGRVLRYPLGPGEQLLASKLVGDGSTGSGLAFSIPPGMRGVSVAFSEVMGAGGLVVPGDHVDVLVATEYGRLFGPDHCRRAWTRTRGTRRWSRCSRTCSCWQSARNSPRPSTRAVTPPRCAPRARRRSRPRAP
ncbi:MAG: Flp pilus assembly protein CpaB [Dehalococcoidia bacterium]|nr:Flp pilus assembly protein CpaB [Dehalococcoidia bacterium]